MRLCVVVAPNGLGHFRRVVRLLTAVLERSKLLQVNVVAEAWQREATRSWPEAEALWSRGVTLTTGVMEPGVGWSDLPSAFDDGRLLGWESRLAKVEAFAAATHVWSDNLAGVLELRPDAFLTGSFLWSDVLSAHVTPAVAAFVEHERRLLAQHRPWMLGVKELAMPGVEQRTRAQLVPWMCEWRGGAQARRGVAVLGGRTGTVGKRVAHIAGALEGRWAVRTDDSLSHDETGYGALEAAVLRPGAGSITDCVASAVPMLLLDEPDNPELAHNARVVHRLGLGRVLPRGEEPRVADYIAEMTDSKARRAYAEAFAAQRTDGIAAGADWLLEHLNLVRAR